MRRNILRGAVTSAIWNTASRPWAIILAHGARLLRAAPVYRWFVRLRDGHGFETINHHLLMLDRETVGREASPSAAVIDSQSVKTTEAGGPRGARVPRIGARA